MNHHHHVGIDDNENNNKIPVVNDNDDNKLESYSLPPFHSSNLSVIVESPPGYDHTDY